MVLRPAKSKAATAGLTALAIEPHYLLATWRNVCITVWIDETPAEAVREAHQILRRMGTEWPDGIAFLQVIGEDNQTLEGPARAAIKDLLSSGRGVLREAPVVYEGSGFRAAAVRAIVTGLLNQRYGFPNRVYSSIDEAALAVARQFEKREPTRFARELCEALESLRDRHQRAFPSASHSFIRYRG